MEDIFTLEPLKNIFKKDYLVKFKNFDDGEILDSPNCEVDFTNTSDVCYVYESTELKEIILEILRKKRTFINFIKVVSVTHKNLRTGDFSND